MTYEYLIALGSSIEPRNTYLADATLRIQQQIGKVTNKAGILETDPMGETAKQLFLNTALICESSQAPNAVMTQLLAIEEELGRTREVHWADRTIDLDIILIKRGGESLILNSDRLTVPHPHCHKRDFVLIPCEEIARDWLHPQFNETLGALKNKLEA